VRNDNTNNSTGWCVEAHDLAASKLVAFRDKDRDFVRTLLGEGLIQPRKLLRRLSQLPQTPRLKPALRKAIDEWVRGVLRDFGLRS
jgi:hypothetical protein